VVPRADVRPGAAQQGGGGVVQEAVCKLGGQYERQRVVAGLLRQPGQLGPAPLDSASGQQGQCTGRVQTGQRLLVKPGSPGPARSRDGQSGAGETDGLPRLPGQGLQQGGSPEPDYTDESQEKQSDE
jgi:hypothetical protein